MAKKQTMDHTALLVLSLLSRGDMYGYQMIAELERQSDHTFSMKEGTLYPILHGLEKGKLVTAREQETPEKRRRRYYRITAAGLRALEEKQAEWETYARAVTAVLAGT